MSSSEDCDLHAVDGYEHSDPSLVYTPIPVPGQGCPEAFHQIITGNSCSCTPAPNEVSGYCLTSTCSCLRGRISLYDESGCIAGPPWPEIPVFECRASCACSTIGRCGRRVVQGSPAKGLKVKESGTKGKGKGLFCDHRGLKRGQFVCLYAGEVIGVRQGLERDKRGRMRGEANYIVFLRETFSPSGSESDTMITVVDPTVLGNIGRYANHSCQPNLVMIPVRTDTMVPSLAMFASQEVAGDTELTFDYGNPSQSLQIRADVLQDDYPEETMRLTPCLCNSKLCRGFLPFHHPIDGFPAIT